MEAFSWPLSCGFSSGRRSQFPSEQPRGGRCLPGVTQQQEEFSDPGIRGRPMGGAEAHFPTHLSPNPPRCFKRVRFQIAPQAGLGIPAPRVCIFTAAGLVVPDKEDPEGNHTLPCRAPGFSPANLTLTWLQEGKEPTLDSRLKGTRTREMRHTRAGQLWGSFRRGAEIRLPGGAPGPGGAPQRDWVKCFQRTRVEGGGISSRPCPHLPQHPRASPSSLLNENAGDVLSHPLSTHTSPLIWNFFSL
ncbi:uncharacterized protein LOC100607730 [Nomascus leucogenys]|uniref:uncharacterized protein LOC100607730 n=1 Tax=Nomascus leucogenys TaxID=61853 RepID=UPI00122D7B90|nr:uncharacterized protein LOC100607730 [Nomascus leucogenys]